MALLQKTLLFIAAWNRVNALEAADYTFGQFCRRPPNFGAGKLIENDACEVTYNVELDTDVAAANFCDQQNPYSLKSFKRNGAQTICTIGSYFKCGSSEVLIDKTCYLLKEDKEGVDILDAFRNDCGGSKYAVHKFKSQFEQKWVATFFTKHPMLWIANKPDDPITKHLRFALREEVLVSKNGRMKKLIEVDKSRVMAIVTSVRTHTRIPRGSIVRADEHLSLPVLCSRPAEELPSYVPALMEKFSELGLTSYIKKDKHNKDRPFFVLREYSSFDMSEKKGAKGREGEYTVGTKSLHKGCSAFLNGYAASPLDFQNVNDFKDILEKEKVNIVSVPGRRARNFVSMIDCKGRYEEQTGRNDFVFDPPNGESQTASNSSYWAKDHPNMACADTPRIALGFSNKGSVDIPATARHFTVCTYGAAPPRGEGVTCHFAATKKNGKCSCNVKGTDYNEQHRFNKTKTYTSGELCVDCEMEANHAVVIVVDVRNGEAFMNIVPHVMFPFIVTESYITTVFYGKDVWSDHTRYALAKDGKNYDHWRWIKGEVKVGRGKTLFDALNSFKDSYFQSAPAHRRVLIIMTAETNEDAVKKLLEEVKRKWNLRKIFAFANYDAKKKWPTVDEKVYHVKGTDIRKEIEIRKASTDISQHAAMNVCLREKDQ